MFKFYFKVVKNYYILHEKSKRMLSIFFLFVYNLRSFFFSSFLPNYIQTPR